MTTPSFGPGADQGPGASTDDPPTSGAGADFEATGATLDQVLDGIHGLQARFDAKIRYDEVRERAVQSMSDELAGYRENQAQRQLRPLLIDLISLHDDLTKTGAAADCAADTAKVLDHFRDTVEQILARNGVEPFTVEGDALDRTRQRVISVSTSGEPSADRKVAQRLRLGFRWHDSVLRQEWVSVYRHVPSSPPTEPTAPPEPAVVPESDEGVLR